MARESSAVKLTYKHMQSHAQTAHIIIATEWQNEKWKVWWGQREKQNVSYVINIVLLAINVPLDKKRKGLFLKWQGCIKQIESMALLSILWKKEQTEKSYMLPVQRDSYTHTAYQRDLRIMHDTSWPHLKPPLQAHGQQRLALVLWTTSGWCLKSTQ